MFELISDIIDEIANNPLSYKSIRRSLRGLPRFKKYNPKALDNALYTLRKKNLIQQEATEWTVTAAGKKYVKRKQDSLTHFSFNFAKDAPKNLIVMFNIPEEKKGEREWFRWELKRGNYVMIQKSVWVGPSPLPKEFLKYVKKIGLKESIKTFKLAKGYKH